ncbi:flavodoxin [Latilactobacillus curvatus]|uniref:flavodoxin n=1 Tax=Latilactobacillus curvatus TaxID=28038 RepID=UPI0020C7E8BE|nr:flavodoxin [Latilactobacillus curvatus]MCP8848766.1 flavodoxin [Latilactobacillus curvatus]MCP8865442.1 flavodoxin [Latilactobacillus curvatus]MCP8874318.1 flavodoxin [Latilactobacillus curvatus]MCP8876112.1 flavodoxin [Latilactobacillus curvatus]MCP8879706.1 flavodoxin [Latilactobacillus curvatus]
MATAKVVYASMTGNNEEIAEIVEEALESLNVDVETTEISQADPADFEDSDICIVCSYTYGDDGDLPDEAVDFYEDLKDIDLTGKVYGVCGSGDTFYDDFCKVVDDFAAVFEQTGATKGSDVVKVDLSAEAEDIEHLEKFVSEIVAKQSAS